MKLRAWLKKEKIMVDVLEWYSNGRVGVSIHDSGPFLKQPEEIILMQFTGLKDKNGKEIFEGDILKHLEENYIGKVWFSGSSFVSDCAGFGPEDLDEIIGEIEIIGNIHQNPELLK